MTSAERMARWRLTNPGRDHDSRAKDRMRIRVCGAASFSEAEVRVLDTILRTMMRGGDMGRVAQVADFAGVCRKVETMKRQVAERKARRAHATG